MAEDHKAGPVAIVTGAAGGMGSAAAALLSAEGRPLILCDLKSEPLEAVAEPLRGAGTVETLAGDIADTAFPQRLVEMLGGREIGAVIHTAGLSPTMAEGAKIVDVNFHATMRLVDALRAHMAEGSCAVLIASMAAHMVASPEIDKAVEALLKGETSPEVEQFSAIPQGAYPLSKRAVVRLVAREAAGFGARKARIMSLSPGLIDTSMGRAEQAASEQMDTMLAMTPLQRMGVAEHIASVAVFLCSPGAAYMTGSDVRVDGGTLAAMGF